MIVEYLPTGYSTRRDGRVRRDGRDLESTFTAGRGWFRDAAKALCDIDHPSLPRVPEYFDADGTTYMVVEPEVGRPLDGILDRAGTLPEGKLKSIVT